MDLTHYVKATESVELTTSNWKEPQFKFQIVTERIHIISLRWHLQMALEKPERRCPKTCGGPRHIHIGPIHLKFCLYKCVTFRMAPLARGEHKQPMDSAQRIKDLKVFATEGNFKTKFTVRWRGASVLAVLSKVRGCWTLLPSLTSRWEVQVLAIPGYSHEVMSLSFVLILFRNARQVSCLFIYDNY